jgi:hypothetical protein
MNEYRMNKLKNVGWINELNIFKVESFWIPENHSSLIC